MSQGPANVFTYELTNGTIHIVEGDSVTLCSIICNTTIQGSVLGNWVLEGDHLTSTALNTYQGIAINISAASGLPLKLTITAPAGCTLQIICS